MAAALNAGQLRKINERIEAAERALSHLRSWINSGQFNAYGVAHAQRLVFPFTIETSEDPYEARKKLYKRLGSWGPTKRFSSPGMMSELPKLLSDGYRMVDSVEEAARILAENGDVE